jgi:hypothetical protein
MSRDGLFARLTHGFEREIAYQDGLFASNATNSPEKRNSCRLFYLAQITIGNGKELDSG